jgi:serine phosphatase RsbU (regulator of sigma subunit)/tetratricopeptide (TPR) repeat protein
MKKTIPGLFFLFFVPLFVSSQDQRILDSLTKLAQKIPADTIAVEALREIGWEWEGQNDSLCLAFARKAKALAIEVGNLPHIALCEMDIGIAFEHVGKPDSALFHYKIATEYFAKAKDEDGIAAVDLNVGATYRSMGDFSEALHYYLAALKIAEKYKNEGRIADSKSAIGNIYRQKGNLDIARKYLQESLNSYEKLNDEEGIARSSNNIGIVYSEMKEHELALKSYFRALQIREKLKMQSSMANTYSAIGCEYNDLGDTKNAMLYHNKALTLNQRLDNKKGIAIDFTNIAAVETREKRYAPAIEKLTKASEYAAAIKFRDLLKETYHALAENYGYLNNYKQAYEYHQKYSLLKDSIINEQENNAIAEMSSKYESEKKDSEIRLLNKDKEVQNAALKRKSIITWSAVLGMVLLMFLAFYIYRGYRIKQKANEIIVLQKQEVEKQKAIIEEKQKEITDSIHYAKRIQRALMASDTFLEKHLRDYFILYKPKDMSGDFYWSAKTSDGKILLATADCTGHGVPGAFMSLLGVNFLNEIISDKNCSSPERIFMELRKHIIGALNPEGIEMEGKDGMDAVLCSFDFSAMQLQFSAANNPLWLIRNKQLKEYLPDKMPIGKYFEEQRAFSLQSLEIKKGDIIYTLTDGYADQFGGKRGKKFKIKPLQELLLSISDLSMQEQRQVLDKTIEEWKGNGEQIDDILVIGVKI